MKKIAGLLLFIFLINLLPCVGMAQGITRVYVSPTGSDAGDGTEQNPFNSIDRAREYVRSINDDMNSDIEVVLKEGQYFLEETLRFSPEDSGTNGYYVRYTALDGAEVTVSGGRRLSPEQSDNGLWVMDTADIPYVSELYVNDKKAKRSQSDEVIIIEDMYTLEDSAYEYDGIIVSKEHFSVEEDLSKLQIHSLRGWKDYMLNVIDVVEINDKQIALVGQQPIFNAASRTTSNHPLMKDAGFYAENVFSELDTPGEFFFDKEESKVYYMPKDGERIESAEIIAPLLEEMIVIEGTDTNNKVKNLEFSNLTFAHGAWFFPSNYGFVAAQAAEFFTENVAKGYKEPGISVTPANIRVDCASHINFTNDVFKFMAAAGIGMYNGVSDCNIVGNVFEDMVDTAVLVGLNTHNYMAPVTKGYDLSTGNKMVSTCSDHPNLPAAGGNDGTNKCWAPNDSNDEEGHIHWWSVDLGTPQKIDRIELEPRLEADQPTTRRNIEIIASNDPDFETYSVLATVGNSPFSATETISLTSRDRTEYRYIMVRKTVPEYFTLAEIRLIDEDREYAPPKEVCKNINISNNYITRVGDGRYSAVAISLFYTQNVHVTHNDISHVPYSGITSGWGWFNFADSKTCKDNVFAYNLIDGAGERSMDGGCIYTLGNQPNTIICGNYFKNQYNVYGSIYLDAGSQYYQVYDNVMENVITTNFPNSGGLDLKFWNNYGTAQATNNAGLSTVEDVKYYIPGTPPEDALKIMMNAGLQEEYEHIKKKADIWAPELTLEMKYQNVVNEPQHQVDTSLVSYYLTKKLVGAKEILAMAEVGTELGQYPQESYDKFKALVDNASVVAKRYPVDRWEVVKTSDELMKGLTEFGNSKNKVSFDELVAFVEDKLSNAKIGNSVGEYTQEQYNKILDKLSDIKNRANTVDMNSEKGEYLYLELEAAYKTFEESQISLNITNWSYTGQSGKTGYDSEAGVIYTRYKRTTDVTAITPYFETNEYVTVTPESGEMIDLTEGVVYTVSTKDGTQKKQWTVKAELEETINTGENIVTPLDELIEDSDNWVSAGTLWTAYEGKSIGNSTIEFDIEISSNPNDWPGFTFRNKYADKGTTDKNNEGYLICFNSKSLEFYRFNHGERFQFIGEAPNMEPIISKTASYGSFKFDAKNRIRLTTRNEADGVRIILWVNGEEVINVLDNYEGKILEPGYFGYVEPSSSVKLFKIYETYEKNIEVLFHGRKIEFPVSTMLVNNRTLVPMRALAEAVGAEVLWDGASYTAIAKKNHNEVKFTISDAEATVNGVNRTMDVPAMLKNNYTMVPIRFLTESLGYTVTWDNSNSRVIVE